MNRRSIVVFLLILALSIGATIALAGFIQGSVGFGSIHLELDNRGGADTVNVSITSSGLTGVCRNNGGNEPPGQIIGDLDTQYATAIKDSGRDTVNLHIAVEFCPNDKNWSYLDLTAGNIFINIDLVKSKTSKVLESWLCTLDVSPGFTVAEGDSGIPLTCSKL